MFYFPFEKTLFKQLFPKSEEKSKKLVSVLATFTLVIETIEKTVETIETAGKNGEESKNEYLEDLA